MTTHAPTPTPPLRQSEAELQALFSAISDVILVLDADGRYVKIAPTSPSLLYRHAPEELVGIFLVEDLVQRPPDQLGGGPVEERGAGGRALDGAHGRVEHQADGAGRRSQRRQVWP